jgi:hypothetical protein
MPARRWHATSKRLSLPGQRLGVVQSLATAVRNGRQMYKSVVELFTHTRTASHITPFHVDSVYLHIGRCTALLSFHERGISDPDAA